MSPKKAMLGRPQLKILPVRKLAKIDPSVVDIAERMLGVRPSRFAKILDHLSADLPLPICVAATHSDGEYLAFAGFDRLTHLFKSHPDRCVVAAIYPPSTLVEVRRVMAVLEATHAVVTSAARFRNRRDWAEHYKWLMAQLPGGPELTRCEVAHVLGICTRTVIRGAPDLRARDGGDA